MSPMNEQFVDATEPALAQSRRRLSWPRDVLLPAATGLILYAVNFYEAGLNAVPFFLSAPFAPAVWASSVFIESGLLGLLVVSLLLGAASHRASVAWGVFYLPAYVARFVVGSVLFSRGEANLWPAIAIGELMVGVVALAAFVASRYVRDKILHLYSQ